MSPAATDEFISFEQHGLDLRTWNDTVAHYTVPDERRSWIQVGTTLLPYVAAWALLPLASGHPVLLVLDVLAIAVFWSRMFALMHELAHRALFKHRRTNDIFATIFAALAFTSMHMWRRDHLLHHATNGNMDRRGSWEVWTLRVEEYQSLSRIKRIGYRIYRNPIFWLGIAPTYAFVIDRRIARRYASRRMRISVHLTSAYMFVQCVGLSLIMGWQLMLGATGAMIVFAGGLGAFILFVQHQHEDTYHQAPELWNYTTSALQGSTFLRLPFVMRWMLADAGYHHVHHLVPMVPNYYLKRIHDENPIFHETPEVTLLSGFRCFRVNLWCDTRKRLVAYRDAAVPTGVAVT